VYSPPSNPVFSNVVSKFYCESEECILATLDKLVTVECYVVGGSKPIELNMFKNGAKLTNTNKTSKDINTITYNYIRYSFIPTMSDINAMFTCTVNNPAIQEPLATSIMLYTEGMCLIRSECFWVGFKMQHYWGKPPVLICAIFLVETDTSCRKYFVEYCIKN
jgi:hypothetical protein